MLKAWGANLMINKELYNYSMHVDKRDSVIEGSM